MSGGNGSMAVLSCKGQQDTFLLTDKGDFPYKTLYSRTRNYAIAPKKLPILGQIEANGSCIIQIQSLGDLLTGVWIEGADLKAKLLGTRFDLYIGGQMVDSQTTDYINDIWHEYLSESQSKTSLGDSDTFYPLHFFFCDNDMFLPLVSLQYSAVEIRVSWGSSISASDVSGVYGNFVYLDKAERFELQKPFKILITQVQRMPVTNAMNIDLSVFNHPVKAFFFGVPFDKKQSTGFTFTSADILLNGVYLLEQMSPTYFYIAQKYYNTKHSEIAFEASYKTPTNTQYFMYSFAKDTGYQPTCTCNFSRLDNAKMNLNGAVNTNNSMFALALNYNVLSIKDGLGGVIFGN